MRRTRFSALTAAGLAIGLAASPLAAAEDGDGPASSLADRARAALDLYTEASRSPERREAVRADLLAFADSLVPAGQDSLAVVCLEHAGILFFLSGRLDAAQATWTLGLERARVTEQPALMVRCLNARAVGFGAAGEYEKAIAMFADQIPIRDELGDAHGLGVVWANLAHAYQELGRIPEAIEAGESALAHHRRADNPMGLSSTYGLLSALLSTVGNYPQALVWADSAVAIARRHDRPSALGTALGNLSDVQFALGRFGESLATLDEAVAVDEASDNVHYGAWVKMQRAAPLIRLGRAEEALSALDATRADVEAQGNPVLLARFRTVEGTALIETGRLDEAEECLALAVKEFESARDALVDESSAVGLLQASGELYAAHARCRLERGSVEEAWAAVERGRAARFRRHVGTGSGAPDLVAIAELQAALAGSRAVLLQFSDSSINPTIVFRVTAETLVAHAVESGIDLEPDIRSALDLIAAGASEAACAPALRSLGERLLTGVLEGIHPGVERLYVVVPAVLSGFPLESLPIAGAAGTVRPLGERYAVTYLPGASVLRTVVGRGPAEAGMVAFADPTGGEGPPSSPGAPSNLRRLRDIPLPNAREEARRVSRGNFRIHLGADATREQAIGPEARAAAVLHFATHAEVDPIRGDLSALVLAGPDGVLTAGEIETLDWRADLVTLSGCRTSGGYTYLGEGTFGLARAFLLAGARSIVGSAWDVEDRAASRFMVLFYDALEAGHPRDEALRRARVRMAEEGFPPRDRFAFVMSGLGHLPVESLVGQASSRRPPVRSRALVFALAALLVLGIAARSTFLRAAR